MQPCFGVKGISPLHILPSFNIVDGAVIDYMHCLLEGIGKKLFQLWLSPSANGYYIGRSAELISHRLTTIKPPDTITRTPRPLSTRKKWKGDGPSIKFCVHLHVPTILTKYFKLSRL